MDPTESPPANSPTWPPLCPGHALTVQNRDLHCIPWRYRTRLICVYCHGPLDNGPPLTYERYVAPIGTDTDMDNTNENSGQVSRRAYLYDKLPSPTPSPTPTPSPPTTAPAPMAAQAPPDQGLPGPQQLPRLPELTTSANAFQQQAHYQLQTAHLMQQLAFGIQPGYQPPQDVQQGRYQDVQQARFQAQWEARRQAEQQACRPPLQASASWPPLFTYYNMEPPGVSASRAGAPPSQWGVGGGGQWGAGASGSGGVDAAASSTASGRGTPSTNGRSGSTEAAVGAGENPGDVTLVMADEGRLVQAVEA